jgi:succinate-semialdehyde dehydrogenase/glutarate-semialdehyde dehydrogenase
MQLADPELFLEASWVDGRPVTAGDGATLTVTNPADGSRIGRVPALAPAEVERAIRAAAAAFPAWRARTAKERAAVLRRWSELLLAHQSDLALLITLEGGKPLAEAKGEVAYAASFLEWFGEEAKRCDGQVIPSHKAGSHIVVLREPVGVVATITPWNFPAAMIARKSHPRSRWLQSRPSRPRPRPFTALALVKPASARAAEGALNVVTGEPTRVGAVHRE